MPEDGSTPLIAGKKHELEYYRVVRMTLHGIDGVRLKASVAGLTLSSMFIGVGFTSSKYVGILEILQYEFPLNYFLSLICCSMAALVGKQFQKKVEMFSGFIVKSIAIAHKLEDRFVTQRELKLTDAFQEVSNAGERGEQLFKQSLTALFWLAIAGAVMSALAFLYSVSR